MLKCMFCKYMPAIEMDGNGMSKYDMKHWDIIIVIILEVVPDCL